MSKSNVPVKWAQIRDKLYITIDVPEVKQDSLKVSLTEDKLVVNGTDGNKEIDVNLELYDKVNTEDSKWSARGKQTEVIITKKTSSPYWPRLLKESTKYNWLKVDWNRWVAEDDSDNDMPDFSSLPNFNSFGSGYESDDEYEDEDEDEDLENLDENKVEEENDEDEKDEEENKTEEENKAEEENKTEEENKE